MNNNTDLTKICTDKTCTIKIGQALNNFYKDRLKEYGKQNKCKKCSDKDRIARKNRNRELEAKRRSAGYHKLKEKNRPIVVSRRYGITVEEYNKLIVASNGICSICNLPEFRKYKNGITHNLSIDHCHKTGKVRGLLCNNCNRCLGLLKDRVEILENAIKYLQKIG